jgi:glycosyltransferase involved in cell wall biosynthesis
MLMSAAIHLSVALVTRNRPESLRRCLASLRAQSLQPFEVIVSDDSEDSSAAARIAQEFAARHIVGPRRGLYANRNAAALACRGTHIRTMDDDHTFPAGHFARCLEAIARDPKAIWTTGEICLLDGHQHGIAHTANQLHPSGLGTPVANPDDNWSIADGSTIYPAEIFAGGARMVEDFSYGPSYLEFGAWLYHRGFRSRCVEGALVEHHASRETLERDAYDFAAEAGWLFSALCYNLYFRPNLARAAKYTAAVLRRSKARLRLLRELPTLTSRARERWQPRK